MRAHAQKFRECGSLHTAGAATGQGPDFRRLRCDIPPSLGNTWIAHFSELSFTRFKTWKWPLNYAADNVHLVINVLRGQRESPRREHDVVNLVGRLFRQTCYSTASAAAAVKSPFQDGGGGGVLLPYRDGRGRAEEEASGAIRS